MFKTLTAKEEQTYRNWARENYTPLDEIPEFWHPVVRDECTKINLASVDLDTVEIGADGIITARRPFRAVHWADLFEDSELD